VGAILDKTTKRNLVKALQATRQVLPGQNNWLLFAAMVEAGLCFMGEWWDPMRVDYAIQQHKEWFVGDGTYGDGPHFHWDYYNSLVIQPMLLQVLETVQTNHRRGVRCGRWFWRERSAMRRFRSG
jgi:hypothetical protein